MVINVLCTICGKEFTAKSRKALYCSGSCRIKASRRRNFKYAWQLEERIALRNLKKGISLLSRERYETNRQIRMAQEEIEKNQLLLEKLKTLLLGTTHKS
jgi:hypothetical protein